MVEVLPPLPLPLVVGIEAIVGAVAADDDVDEEVVFKVCSSENDGFGVFASLDG